MVDDEQPEDENDFLLRLAEMIEQCEDKASSSVTSGSDGNDHKGPFSDVGSI